jgi:hypothetical protein
LGKRKNLGGLKKFFYLLYQNNVYFCELEVRKIRTFSSQNNSMILDIYNDSRTVFSFNSIALLIGETNSLVLRKKLNYYAKTGELMNPRKGIYTKKEYKPEELACLLYTPSYISLEFVLQKAGIVFQYDSRITAISYLSRSLEIDGKDYQYRKLKNEILANTIGIKRENNINIATAERAFLDVMYLNKNYYFDNINPLNKKLLLEILPIYKSKLLTQRVTKLLKNV